MRRISLVLDGSARDSQSIKAALALTLRLGAQVEGFFIRPGVSEIMAQFGDSITSAISGDVIDQILKDADEFAAKSKSLLESAARANGLAVFDKPSRQTTPGAAFEIIQGPSLDALDEATDLSELVVFGEPDHTGSPTPLSEQIEYTMLTLRRPVLVARGKVDAKLGERAIVAFDGRHESCTALIRALPVLAAAQSVELLHIHEHGSNSTNRLDRGLRYLSQNGVNASAIEAKPSDAEVGARIVEMARMSDRNLVIMGGYGRSRMRELVLGGATRFMMRHSPIPVLFAH